jgi:hypothetical protein
MRMRWEKLAGVRTTLLILAGFACVVYGVALIFPPAGWIAGGVALLLIEGLSDA